MAAEGRALAAAAILTLSWGQAQAADPALCRQYARSTLVQVRTGLANAHCGAGLKGKRWSTEFAVHYEWCLETPPPAVAAEREARSRTLQTCPDD